MPSPRRMTLTDVETGRWIFAQFNPTTPEVELEAFWNRLKVPGQSHEELQYSNTGNFRVRFELLFDSRLPDAPVLDQTDAFLWSLLFPPDEVTSASTGAPSRILFTWPNWISIVTVMPKLKLSPRRFALNGAPDYSAYAVELESIRSTRLGRDIIRRNGLRVPQ